MSDDIERPDDQDSPPPTTVTVDRKVLLIGLAGFATLAVILAVMRARTAPRPTLGADLTGPDADWRTSLEHLAHAFDLRLTGIDARLDQLAGEHVAAAAAAFSTPAVNLNGDVPERVPPTVGVGANEPAPPAPAAVSLPTDVSDTP